MVSNTNICLVYSLVLQLTHLASYIMINIPITPTELEWVNVLNNNISVGLEIRTSAQGFMYRNKSID